MIAPREPMGKNINGCERFSSSKILSNFPKEVNDYSEGAPREKHP